MADCIECCITDGKVSFNKLSSLIDKYKFQPKITRKGAKNCSYNFWSRAFKQEQETFKGPSTLGIAQYFQFLSEKIDEKFMKLTQAFRFFDYNRTGRITLSDFKLGLDNLCLRIDEEKIKGLFIFLDTKKDGYIDLDEFCELSEEAREIKAKAKSTKFKNPYNW